MWDKKQILYVLNNTPFSPFKKKIIMHPLAFWLFSYRFALLTIEVI